MSLFGALASGLSSGLAQQQAGLVNAQQQMAQQQMALSQYNSLAALGGTSTANPYLPITASTSSTSTNAVYIANTLGCGSGSIAGFIAAQLPHNIVVPDGRARSVTLPDGTIIEVKADGSFEIQDKAAKVIYRANRVRDFNPFLNASDKIEEFIAFCGAHGVRQGEMLELPINLFIGWLVLEAAKADREPEPNLPLLADLRKRAFSRCRSCGRFMKEAVAAKKIEFCASSCFERSYQKALAA